MWLRIGSWGLIVVGALHELGAVRRAWAPPTDGALGELVAAMQAVRFDALAVSFSSWDAYATINLSYGLLLAWLGLHNLLLLRVASAGVLRVCALSTLAASGALVAVAAVYTVPPPVVLLTPLLPVFAIAARRGAVSE